MYSIEAKVTSEGQSGDELGAGDEAVRGGVGVVTSGEVPVV